MRGLRLDHVTLNTDRLSETMAFYESFLGLKPGWRPDFGFPGAWLYPAESDYPIVHLIGAIAVTQGGMFDHIAFRGHGLQGYLKKVKAAGEWFHAMSVPGTPFTQVHHRDPNGVKIEVTFEEPLPTDSGSAEVGASV